MKKKLREKHVELLSEAERLVFNQKQTQAWRQDQPSQHSRPNSLAHRLFQPAQQEAISQVVNRAPTNIP